MYEITNGAGTKLATTTHRWQALKWVKEETAARKAAKLQPENFSIDEAEEGR